VSFAYGGGVRCNRTVERDADRSGLQQRVVGVALCERVELGHRGLRQQAARRKGGVDADQQITFAARACVQRELVGVGAGILNARNTVAMSFVDGGPERSFAVGWARLRNMSAHEVDGCVL
jgi:hypothetical protein